MQIEVALHSVEFSLLIFFLFFDKNAGRAHAHVIFFIIKSHCEDRAHWKLIIKFVYFVMIKALR